MHIVHIWEVCSQTHAHMTCTRAHQIIMRSSNHHRSSAVVPKNKLTKKVNLLVPGGIKADFFLYYRRRSTAGWLRLPFPCAFSGLSTGTSSSSSLPTGMYFHYFMIYIFSLFLFFCSSLPTGIYCHHFKIYIYISIIFFSSSLQTGTYFHYFMIHTFSLFSSMHFHSFMMYIFALHIFVHYSFHT